MNRYSLIIKNINKNFGKITAVKDFNLSIREGEFVSLLGPSGCGKTTLLRIIAGFEVPNTGEVFIDKKNILFDPPYARPINTVFQRYALFPHMNVFENIAFSQFLKKINKDKIKKKVNEILKLVQLEGFSKRMPNELSGGQAQRVALGRSLINEPKVLLLDEPLAALDLKVRKQMQVELKNIQKQLGVTFIYVTHDQGEAIAMSDRIVLMNYGEILQIGTPKEIYFNPNSNFSATFIGENNIYKGTVKNIGKDHVLIKINDEFKIITDKIDSLKLGAKVSLAIRPEKIRRIKISQDKKYDNKFDVKVLNTTFFGASIKHIVEMPGNLKMLVEENILGEEISNSINKIIQIGFRKEDVRIIIK